MVKYEKLMEEARETIPTVMASMSKLVEMRYQMDMQSTSQWLGSAFSKGLSALSTIETIKIQARVQFRTNRSEEAPFGQHLQAISGMRNLHTFEFSVSSECNLPSDLDDLWRAMQAANIQLRSISVDDVSPSLLEYLASFRGLCHLALSLLMRDGMASGDGEEKMVSFLFKVVVRHSGTLSHLAVAGRSRCWCITEHNISALARCRSLKSLTTSLKQNIDFDFLTPLEFIFEYIQTLPSLRQLVLQLTRIFPDPPNYWRMGIAPQVLLSVHNAVTSIEHHEVSLVPEVLTIEYGNAGSVEYRLVELQLGSGAKTWRYYGEKPAWFHFDWILCDGMDSDEEDSIVSGDFQRRMQQQKKDRIAERVTYAAEQKAKGVLPGQF
ncbi:hypothetical protein CPB83DRAFT_411938 [Crepidotus variabilis]|uniref:Uncharacterized protein n=1 Tax=Crepidotus variabilis TaxID=179855 RepID=A0A9P6ERY3_9AGAR|nr:hypothetical protein CPB83DRAFT_411938 [Crepidotus variabilis]